MKRIYACILFACSGSGLSSQDYTLNPSNLNVQGNPGDFLLSTLIVNNPSANTITMRLERIVRNLPPNWTSCFCFPTCVAPFLDTLTFTIAAFSMDSIKPNYATDSVPGIGYITIKFYQTNYPNSIDTIAFTGSTLSSSGIESPETQWEHLLFPNPFNRDITIWHSSPESYAFRIYDPTGKLVYHEEHIAFGTRSLDLEFLPEGIYFALFELHSGTTFTDKIIKTK